MKLLSKWIRPTTKVLMLALLGLQSITPAMAFVKGSDFTCGSPVSEAILDSMRGGFQRGPNGPFMSFGIERNVFDNGKLVSSTVLKIPDMARLADRDWNPFADRSNGRPSADQSARRPLVEHAHVEPVVDHTAMRPATNRSGETFTLIQSGPGHSLPHDLSSLPPFATIIQNSLDNRTIQSETVINATVEAMTWARSLQLGHALSQANISAIRQ